MKDTIRRYGRIIKGRLSPKPTIKGPVPPGMVKKPTPQLSEQAKSYQKALDGVKKKGGSSGIKVGP